MTRIFEGHMNGQLYALVITSFTLIVCYWILLHHSANWSYVIKPLQILPTGTATYQPGWQGVTHNKDQRNATAKRHLKGKNGRPPKFGMERTGNVSLSELDESLVRRMELFYSKHSSRSKPHVTHHGNTVWVGVGVASFTRRLRLFHEAIDMEGIGLLVTARRDDAETQRLMEQHTLDTQRHPGLLLYDSPHTFTRLNQSRHVRGVFMHLGNDHNIPHYDTIKNNRNLYKNNTLIRRYFKCTAHGLHYELSKSADGDSCSDKVRSLRQHQVTVDPRYLSYHGFNNTIRRRDTLTFADRRLVEFYADWNISCANCRQMPNFATYLHVVQNAFLLEDGRIVQVDELLQLYPLTCVAKSQRVARPSLMLGLLQTKQYYEGDEVFYIASQFQGNQRMWNFYHLMAEGLVKLAMYRDFLRTNPQISIYVLQRLAASVTFRNFLQHWGLENPVMHSNARARVVYVPEGNPCFAPGVIYLQTTQRFFRDKYQFSKKQSNSILYLQRTKKRRLEPEWGLMSYLQKLSSVYRVPLHVYSDQEQPLFHQTAALFHSAALIIGAHGAGLANLVFARPGAAVVEITCPWSPATFKQMAHKLGLRHHAHTGAKMNNHTIRCDGGIYIEHMDALQANLRTVLDIVLHDQMLNL